MEAPPNVFWSQAAASAYKAYAASTGNKNFRGDQMPEFKDLPEAIRIAWQAAARQIGDLYTNLIDPVMSIDTDEAKWKDWKPLV